jgi:hypothetical protein
VFRDFLVLARRAGVEPSALEDRLFHDIPLTTQQVLVKELWRVQDGWDAAQKALTTLLSEPNPDEPIVLAVVDLLPAPHRHGVSATSATATAVFARAIAEATTEEARRALVVRLLQLSVRYSVDFATLRSALLPAGAQPQLLSALDAAKAEWDRGRAAVEKLRR